MMEEPKRPDWARISLLSQKFVKRLLTAGTKAPIMDVFKAIEKELLQNV